MAAGRWLVATLLLAALATCLPQPGLAAGATLPFRFPAGSDSVTNVSAVQQADDVVRFSFQESDFGLSGLRGALVHLQSGSEGIDVSLAADAAPAGQRTWSGDLAVDMPDLVLGTWSATLQVLQADGTQATPAPARNLTVTGTDAAAPVISFPAAQGGIVRIGAFEDVIALVEDPLLRAATFRLPGMQSPLVLPAPYHLAASTFVEGAQLLVVNATDRAGHSTSANVTVVLDRTAPQVAATLPPRLFRGVPAAISVAVADASPYRLTVTLDDANGTTFPATGTGQGVHTFQLPAALAIGSHSFRVNVIDAVGNAREAFVQATLEVPETDVAFASAEVPQQRSIVGEALVLRVGLAQARGVTPLDLNLTYSTPALGNGSMVANVPGPGSSIVEVPLRLPVGQHVIRLNVTGPLQAVELDPSNQERSLTVEVFFGRLRDGDQTYMIRGGPLGLPGYAVSANNTVYPLRLVENAGSSVYAFTAAGNRTLTWDPQTPDGTVPAAAEEEEGEETEDAPFPGALMLVAALAALAILRRRRA